MIHQKGDTAVEADAGRPFIMHLLAGILLTACLFMAARLLFIPALNPEILSSLFHEHADTGASGVPASSYPALAEGIAGFLSGNQNTAQLEVMKDGGLQPAFHEHELVHLQDVKSLADLSGLLMMLVIPLALLYVLLLCVPMNLQGLRIGMLAKSTRLAFAAAVFLLLLAGVWAAIDFNGAFALLHQTVFPNDLWLLDPRTDLMIQLMPQPFFVSYAMKAFPGILLPFLMLLILSFGAQAMRKRVKR